jgi:hypothetical protein
LAQASAWDSLAQKLLWRWSLLELTRQRVAKLMVTLAAMQAVVRRRSPTTPPQSTRFPGLAVTGGESFSLVVPLVCDANEKGNNPCGHGLFPRSGCFPVTCRSTLQVIDDVKFVVVDHAAELMGDDRVSIDEIAGFVKFRGLRGVSYRGMV